MVLYEVHYGLQSDQYDSHVDAVSNTASVAGLQEAQTYYFAVRACNQGSTFCSRFSNEVSTTIPSPAPTAAFTASSTVGVAPMTVDFTDQSSEIVTSWLWDFGDGTAVSTSQSASHVYTIPGSYTVSLAVSGPDGSTTETKTAIIDVGWPSPAADFTTSAASGVAPLIVIFTDTSSGNISERLWDFGDGGSSTATQAVYEYTTPGTYNVRLTVNGPGGTEAKTGAVVVTEPAVTEPRPVAQFTTSVRSGNTPLDVPFQDLSGGQISTWEWSFGDGEHSTERNPNHTYKHPGVYSVTLTVTGSGGTDARTEANYIDVRESEFVWEAGELVIDDRWQWVDFGQPYSDPIVIARRLSAQGSHPAAARLDGIESTGFWIRTQELDESDGWHTPEVISYLVMERGTHQLPDGTLVEAGRIQTEATGAFTAVDFMQEFTTTPVVLVAVTTVGETDAVTTRIRNIDEIGFEVGINEQEANAQIHASEAIDYIAWPPSSGALDGVRFKVGRTGVAVRQSPYRTAFDSGFAAPPLFLADMQTSKGGDTANLRLRNNTDLDVEVWGDEEQSLNSETTDTKEAVGYIVFDAE